MTDSDHVRRNRQHVALTKTGDPGLRNSARDRLFDSGLEVRESLLLRVLDHSRLTQHSHFHFARIGE
jgi:hypothetical protein